MTTIARRCDCSPSVSCVFGFSCSSGRDRGKDGGCKRLARNRPGDILGRVGDGSHRRYREIVRHGCLKIGTAEKEMHIEVRHRGLSRSIPLIMRCRGPSIEGQSALQPVSAIPMLFARFLEQAYHAFA